MRVYELAERVRLGPAELIHRLEQLGISVRSEASVLSSQQVEEIERRLNLPADPPAPPSVKSEPTVETASADEPLRRPILLWGPPASGKSTYLASLVFHHITDSNPIRWDVQPIGADSGAYVASLMRAYRDGGVPPATPANDKRYRFIVRKVRTSRNLLSRSPSEKTELEADLDFLDPSGDLFTASRLATRAGERFKEQFARASGILLLIDPGEKTDASGSEVHHRYFRMLVENISEICYWLQQQPADVRARILDAENRIKLPTAVAVTKMDQFKEHADAADEFLRIRLPSVYNILRNGFTNVRVWGCSALGNNVTMTGARAHVSGYPQPWKVLEPLAWVVEESARKAKKR